MHVDGSDVFFQQDPFELTKGPQVDGIFFGDRGDKPGEGARFFVQI